MSIELADSLSGSGRAIEGQLALFEEQAEACQGCTCRGSGRMDLEAVLGLGVHIYRSIRIADEAWSEGVRAKTLPLRKEDAERLGAWYGAWIKSCGGLLAEIARMEAEGIEMRDAAEFRDACLEVRSVLSIPLERVWGAAKDVSARKPMSEVRDAVRRRLEAGR